MQAYGVQIDRKNVAYARELGMPADLLLDTGHPAGLRMVEREDFSDPASPKCAMLIESGPHWEAAAAEVAIDALARFLGLGLTRTTEKLSEKCGGLRSMSSHRPTAATGWNLKFKLS